MADRRYGPRGNSLTFYFAGASKEDANGIRATLNAIAAEYGYTAKQGPTTGQGNAAALLAALAKGHMRIVPADNAVP